MAKKAAKRSAKKASTTAKRTSAAKSRASETARKARPAAKKSRRKAATRELIDPGSDKRYVRRGARGQFDESDEVSRALPADRRTKAKRRTRSGQGDKGDR
jgi:hypothetical protein